MIRRYRDPATKRLVEYEACAAMKYGKPCRAAGHITCLRCGQRYCWHHTYVYQAKTYPICEACVYTLVQEFLAEKEQQP